MNDQNQPYFKGIEAQQSVVGSMLIDDRCVGAVLSKLREEDFTDGACKSAFRVIRELFTEGRPVDPVTVLDAMHGGETYANWLADLMKITPTAANVEFYADIVKRSTALYRLREQADRLLLAADLDEARRIVQDMSALTTDAGRVERMTAAQLAEDFIRRITSEDKPEYLPWGFPSADRIVYAERGDLCLLGGYPSAGKTLLSIQMALAQAKRYRVGYYTLETRPEKMADRMFAHLAKLSLEAIKRRDLPDQALARAAQAAALFTSETPIDFIRGAGLTVDDIAADAVAKGYEIIYTDYLQLIEVPGMRPGDRYGAVTAVSRGLKIFGQRTNTTVVALAQLSRPEKEKTGKGGEQKLIPPSMQSFRESGQIEQDADVAFLLWAEDPNNNQSQRTFKLGKNKEGRKFSVSLAFNGPMQTMIEVEKPPDNRVAAELAAAGRAAKRANRMNGQLQFQELHGSDDDNPFERGGDGRDGGT